MPTSRPPHPAIARWRWLIRGQVQGVGFRPFLFRLAASSHLTGTVRNTPAGVLLEIQGTPAALDAFARNFQTQLPPLARVDSCQKTKIKTLPRELSFLIDTTEQSPAPDHLVTLSPGHLVTPSPVHPVTLSPCHPVTLSPITPDTALCPDCLREMLDPNDRRYQHALINCTNCGPRFSILKNVPYDRRNTTMAPFKMCPACAREYRNPADRRFHAQPVCCPRCGPKVSLIYMSGNSGRKPGAHSRRPRRARTADPIRSAAQLLLAGKIVALKGLGGFHLAVRADRPAAVSRLRKLKKRDAKPFAIMVPDLPSALALANISPPAQAELLSPHSPIILAPRHSPSDPPPSSPHSLSSPTPSSPSSSPSVFTSCTPLAPPSDLPCAPRTHPSSLIPHPSVAPSVAPGTDLLGLMLPYTPLHHLLLRALAQIATPKRKPVSSSARASSFTLSPCHLVTLSPPPPLVMTSGNLSSEPLVIDNDDALARLGPMCDAILLHDRPIERCVDDSVILDRGPDRPPLPIRRSRGYVPSAFQGNISQQMNVSSKPAPNSSLITLHSSLPSGICLGGELKNTIAVLRDNGGGGEIILSQHLGDLSDARSFAHFQKAVEDLIRLFHIHVQFVAHDLHPTYMSTQYAKALSARFHAPLVPIQHHAAHAFAVMGEHRLDSALAIVCDGTGYGTDSTIWGGELLAIRGTQWQRLGRLQPMRLPGGDAAALDPRRSAMALLYSTFGTGFENLPQAKTLFPKKSDRSMLAHMITTGTASPWTSSTGRLFDAIAALLGICLTNDHEAQAAMALEASAHRSSPQDLPPRPFFQVRPVPPPAPDPSRPRIAGKFWELDMTPLVRHLVQIPRQKIEPPLVPQMAHLFHRELARGMVEMARLASEDTRTFGMNLVASGGSLCNRILEGELNHYGNKAGFRTFFHELYPPTDAGLAFGQAIYCRGLGLTDELRSDKRE